GVTMMRMVSGEPPSAIHFTAVFLARIVMPFSRSRSMESMTRLLTSWPSRKAPDCQSIASTSVVLPWSTWATIATLRRSERTGTTELLTKPKGMSAHCPVPAERAGPRGTSRRTHIRKTVSRPTLRPQAADQHDRPTADAGSTLMDLQLNGRRALVTGGTKGIGRAVVEALAAEGVAVAFCARTEADVKAAETALVESGARA